MKKKHGIIIGVIVFLIICYAVSVGVKSSKNTTTTAKEEKKTEVQTTKPKETKSVERTTAASKTLEDKTYDDPVFSKSGSGDDVVTGCTTTDYSYLRVTGGGNGHFSVKSHYGSDYDLNVNTTKSYDGTTLLFPKREYSFEIVSKGSWNIEVHRLGTSSTDKFSGSTDTVTPMCVATSNVYSIEAPGSGHFSVKGYYGNGDYDLLVNTTDSYSGKVMFNHKGDYCFFVVDSERDWSISPQ